MSSSNRRPYLTSTVLDQALLDACADNLECKLEMAVQIETPTGVIYASDRNKYVGGIFYEALLKFPVIGRTVGEWLATDLQFSSLQIELSNVDGRFNEFLPSGASFGGWIGKSVIVTLGLAEVSATYKTIFKGTITDVGGFKRTTKSIILTARDDYDTINQSLPVTTFQEIAYPKIEPKNVGKLIPYIYGDWTSQTEPAPASVPGFVMNGNDPLVTFKDKRIESFALNDFTVIDHDFDADDPVELTTNGTLPTGFATGTTYYVKAFGMTQDTLQLSATPGGLAITPSGGTGEHKIVASSVLPATRRDVQVVVSENDLTELAEIYVKRGDTYYLVSSGVVVGAGNKSFTVAQAGTWFEGATAYDFEQSDTFWIKCKGKDLSGYDDNLVWQARDILLTFGGIIAGDFHANWATYRDKASPAQSNIAGIKSRVWIGELQTALTYALSMLEQVRLEAFIDRDLKLKINSLHFEDWTAAPTYSVKNWDVVRDSFQCAIDERNNFNAAQAVFNFLPDVNENAYTTAVYQNAPAIAQVGKRIAKKIVFPNLYVQEDVIAQLTEILRLSSSTLEIVSTSLTWRALLQDIGGFVKLDVQIGSAIFDNVPAMIRDVGYDPDGLKIVFKLWALGMVPFPGYVPGYTGTVGGYSATIVVES